MLAKGATDKQAQQVVARCRKIIDAGKFKKLADLSPSAVATYLRERRDATDDGLSIQSSNHYPAAIKSFANRLVKDGRMPTNPLAHLAKLNAKLDIRRERRALSTDELARVINVAETSKTTFRGLDGSTRAMLYRLAAMTGLRVSELASLCFREHGPRGAPIFRIDLEAVRLAWLDEAKDNAAETERRTKSRFLCPVDNDGCVCDFHDLRHSFISNLAAGGVHPKVAQQQA